MTSLVQAKNINSSGVYVVGHLDTKNGVSTEQGRRLSLNNVVQLTVRTKGGSEQVQGRTYSVDELKDLQSKLMPHKYFFAVTHAWAWSRDRRMEHARAPRG